MSHPERIVPDETEPGIVALHLSRYAFAEQWCRGRDVLDVACGVGYGSAFLAPAARTVVGVDLDAGTIAYAGSRYTAGNVEYVVADAAALPFGDGSFDVVCSFETIEHLPDRDAYLTEMTRVLRGDGPFVVSTPRAERTTPRPDNPFHHVELSREDFESLLQRFFRSVEVYGQRRRETLRHRVLRRADVFGLRRRIAIPRVADAVAGSAPTARVTLDDIVVDRASAATAPVMVAVCRGPLR